MVGDLRTNPYPAPERVLVSGYNPETTLETMLNTGTNGVAPNQPSGVGVGRVSEIASAMSQITSNPSASSQGNRSRSFEIKDQLNNQLQMALAINLGLNGPQEEKERALHNVLTSKSARGDLKQVLQSRAEIYGDALDPNWFKPGTDMGTKAKSLRERNLARSQLAGAPLLVAQLGAMEFRDRMIKGDEKVLRTLRLGTQTTVAELLKKFGQAPPVAILELCFGRTEFNFTEKLLQHADDLDFVQDVLSAVGASNGINPVLNRRI